MKLWVDDVRQAPDDWLWATSAPEAIRALDSWPACEVLSLDYSLGGAGDWDNNGGAVLQWLKRHPGKWPTEEICAHSSSAAGREVIVDMAKLFAPEGWTGRITDTGGFQ